MGAICNNNGVDIVQGLNTNVYGNGSQTMVLAHGFGADQTSWHLIIPYFVCYFKVVVFDLAFAGNVDSKLYDEKRYSSFDGYAEDLICVLDELNVKDTIYVGHSMSAMIGGIASIKRPDLFKKLVLYSGSPRYLNDIHYYGGFEMSQINSIFQEMKEDFPSWVKNFAPIAVAVKNNTKAVSEFENSLGRMKPHIALSVAKILLLSDYRSILPRIKTRSFIIISRRDQVAPQSVALYMKMKLGSFAKVNILETEGHFPHLTAYPLLLKALKQVLRIKI